MGEQSNVESVVGEDQDSSPPLFLVVEGERKPFELDDIRIAGPSKESASGDNIAGYVPSGEVYLGMRLSFDISDNWERGRLTHALHNAELIHLARTAVSVDGGINYEVVPSIKARPKYTIMTNANQGDLLMFKITGVQEGKSYAPVRAVKGLVEMVMVNECYRNSPAKPR